MGTTLIPRHVSWKWDTELVGLRALLVPSIVLVFCS